ncbi:hypothetical protein Tco_0734803, partial [Tanacetum coccineum]
HILAATSLENAGEGSVLPMLRSVRLLLDRFALGHKGSGASSSDGIDVQCLLVSPNVEDISFVMSKKQRLPCVSGQLDIASTSMNNVVLLE